VTFGPGLNLGKIPLLKSTAHKGFASLSEPSQEKEYSQFETITFEISV